MTDLPDPDSPTRPSVCPGRSVNEIASITGLPPKPTVRPRTSNNGGCAGELEKVDTAELQSNEPPVERTVADADPAKREATV